MRRRRAPCPRRWRAYVRVGIVWGRMSSPWLALAVLWGLRRVGSVRSYTEDDDAGVSWEEDWHRLQAGWLAGWLPARDGASLKLLPVVSTEASTQLQLWGVLQKEEATCGPVPSQRPAPSSVRRLAGHTRQQDNGPSCGYTREQHNQATAGTLVRLSSKLMLCGGGGGVLLLHGWLAAQQDPGHTHGSKR